VGTTSSDSPQSVQIQNIGNATLTGSGVLSDTTDFTVVPGSGAPPDCNLATLSLAPGAECNLSLDFTPQSAGPQSATLTLSDNALNGTATQTITLSGTGVTPPPQAKLSTTLLQYNIVAFGGAPKTLPLMITNIGVDTLTIAPTINGASYTITSSTCSAGVTAGNSCTLQVQFDPVAIGPRNDTLTLQTNGPTNPTVSLQGIASGIGVETEGPLLFGTVAFGSAEVLTLTVTNVGVSGAVSIGTTMKFPSYKVLTTTQNTCLNGIAAGQSCTLPVEFDPIAVGARVDILTLTPSTGASSTVAMEGLASGVGVEMEGSLQFGTIPVGTTEALPLTITNVGVAGTVMVRMTSGPSYTIPAATNGCLAGISSGQSCQVMVLYNPVGTGVHDDLLTITPSVGAAPSSVALIGSAD
jgi:hypothetical protein